MASSPTPSGRAVFLLKEAQLSLHSHRLRASKLIFSHSMKRLQQQGESMARNGAEVEDESLVENLVDSEPEDNSADVYGEVAGPHEDEGAAFTDDVCPTSSQQSSPQGSSAPQRRTLQRRASFLMNMVVTGDNTSPTSHNNPAASISHMLEQLHSKPSTNPQYAGSTGVVSAPDAADRESAMASRSSEHPRPWACGMRKQPPSSSLTMLSHATVEANPALLPILEAQHKARMPTCIVADFEEYVDIYGDVGRLEQDCEQASDHADLELQVCPRAASSSQLPRTSSQSHLQRIGACRSSDRLSQQLHSPSHSNGSSGLLESLGTVLAPRAPNAGRARRASFDSYATLTAYAPHPPATPAPAGSGDAETLRRAAQQLEGCGAPGATGRRPLIRRASAVAFTSTKQLSPIPSESLFGEDAQRLHLPSVQTLTAGRNSLSSRTEPLQPLFAGSPHSQDRPQSILAALPQRSACQLPSARSSCSMGSISTTGYDNYLVPTSAARSSAQVTSAGSSSSNMVIPLSPALSTGTGASMRPSCSSGVSSLPRESTASDAASHASTGVFANLAAGLRSMTERRGGVSVRLAMANAATGIHQPSGVPH